MTFVDESAGNVNNNEEQAGQDAQAGTENTGDAIGDFGGAVGATGGGGPNPFGGAPGSTGGPTLDGLVDRDMARESPTGPGTSTTGADIGPVST